MEYPPPTPGVAHAFVCQQADQQEAESAASVGELAGDMFEILSQHIDLSEDPKLAMHLGLAMGAQIGKAATQVADAIGIDPDRIISAITGAGFQVIAEVARR